MLHFVHDDKITILQISHASHERLTHVQLMFAWNPSHLDLHIC